MQTGRGLGYMPLLGTLGKVLWGFQSRAAMVNSKQKREDLVNSAVSYLRGA